MRGTRRDSKAGGAPAVKPAKTSLRKLEEWAELELSRIPALIDKGHDYLEKELEALTRDEGNAPKVVALVKYFRERQEYAARLRDHATHGPEREREREPADEPARAQAGRFDFSGDVDGEEEHPAA